MFWEHLREIVDPDEPGVLRLLAAVGRRFERARTPAVRRRMAEELVRAFPDLPWTERTLAGVTTAALELEVQTRVEELVLGRLDATTVDRFVRFDGREHLDAAARDGRGVIIARPHAGNVPMLIARLALSGWDVTRVTAKGFPGRGPARVPSWFDARAHEAREANEDRLPVRVHGTDAPARDLFRALARGGVVVCAIDGAYGRKRRPTRWLGATAMLPTAPWRLAVATGAPIVPAVAIRDKDRSHRVWLGAPLRGDDAVALMDAGLAAIGDVLARHPDHYAGWLVRRAASDRPMFV